MLAAMVAEILTNRKLIGTWWHSRRCLQRQSFRRAIGQIKRENNFLA